MTISIEMYHSILNRRVVFYATKMEKKSHKKKKRSGDRWRLYETYINISINIKGKWKYYYRAVDKQGNAVDYFLTAKRDAKAALRYRTKAIKRSGKPGLLHIDKSCVLIKVASTRRLLPSTIPTIVNVLSCANACI
jgi:putative transposase